MPTESATKNEEPVTPFDATQVSPAIREAMRILELEQADTPGIETLAVRVGLSPSHFLRQFASALGKTSAACGRRIRIDHAASRLLFDLAPIAEVAALFGFDNQAAFNRAFRRVPCTA